MTSINNNLYEGSSLPSKENSKEIFCNADAVCFDVDSTVIRDEGLDQLAAYCGKAEQVKKITEEAMKGGVEFREALRARLNLIRPSLDTVRSFIRENPPKLSKNIETLIKQLHRRNVDVYLVSGGFRSLIAPVAKYLQIPLENIYANRLKFYFDGSYAGFDESQPTSRSGGKAEVIRIMKERNGYASVVMIGDGATDMEACPPAEAFIGYGGNVVRESVKMEATWYIEDFASLTNELGLYHY
ncbi:Phosphoserine phosphatase [Armadillidium vulgare]|nr:Phosphoserine phosphatase [Armadillidium vulgare]